MFPAKTLPPLILGAVIFFSCKPFLPQPSSELKVLFNSSVPASKYDPARAFFTQDYFFLENTFSPLLEYSAAGELTSGLAGTFSWHGAEARFSMREHITTADGQLIDAFDAEMSLKRLFIIGGRDYSLLSGLLCGAAALKQLSDPCSGLQVRDGGRTLVMEFKEKNTFLFHLLTNITYSIIPKNSIDPTSLRIRDHRNTSGPYFVSSDSGGGAWELQANRSHYRYSTRMPQKVKAVPLLSLISNDQALAMLPEGKTDYLITSLVRNPDEKLRFVSGHSAYKINITQPVRLLYVVFTEKGLKTLTKSERFFIARKMRELYKAGRGMCENPLQIFKMEGALSKGQLEVIKKQLNESADMIINKKVAASWLRLYLFRPEDDLHRWLPALTASEPQSQGKRAQVKPDFFLSGGDIGFQDDVGLVSNYIGMEFFNMDKAAKEKWFARYAACPDKKNRSRILQDLHYRTLSEARVLPIALMPYSSVVRKPWKFNYPAMFGGDNLWRLRR